VMKFNRLINGGWDCDVDGIRFTFFKPTPGVPFRGVDFKGDWWCRAYFDGDEACLRARTREEGIRELQETIAELRAKKAAWATVERSVW
jgi:hypothetical protein